MILASKRQRRIFSKRRTNWGAIGAVAACVVIWAGFIYWVVGLG